MGRVAKAVLAAVAACVLAGGGTASAAPVSVGLSGWLWGDPTPQGETLNRVAFLGARGYADGEDGTVLRSDDGGATWAGLSSGSNTNLTLLQEVDANTVVVGGGCTVRESVDGGATFHRLPVNEAEQNCANPVASLSFLSATTGYVQQRDGAVLLTSDSGQTLQPKTSVPLNGWRAEQLVFVSPTTGFALVSSGSGARIYRTTDGAGSWTQVGAASQPLYDIAFVSSTEAYAVGATGTLLHSTDGGATWTGLPLALPPGSPRPTLTQISCSDATHCLIATAPAPNPGANVLVRTTDGGATGTLVSPSGQNLVSVAFSTASTAVAVGFEGATVLSADGGATFPTAISRRASLGTVSRIRLGASAQDAYVPEAAGQIVATTDGGASWTALRVPTSLAIHDVAFPTTVVGYAVSEAGTLYRTSTSGLSWSILGSVGGAPTALLAASGSTLVAVGPTGLRRSTDSGATFAPVSGSVVLGRKHRRLLRRRLSAFPLFSGAEMAGSAMIAWGDDAIESTDGGAHWTLIPRPLRNGNMESLSFVTATSGYAVSRHRLFFTSNRGRTWKEIDSLASEALGGEGTIAFSSAGDGYALFAGGVNELLHTADGGRTWTREALPRKVEALAAGGAVDYAAGGPLGASGIFTTTTGGRTSSASQLRLSIVGRRKLSRAKLRRAHGRVKLAGALSPAQGGETVIVAYRAAGRAVWHQRSAIVASNGRFSLTVPGIATTTDFVAQWRGESPVTGAGTPAVELRVTRR